MFNPDHLIPTIQTIQRNGRIYTFAEWEEFNRKDLRNLYNQIYGYALFNGIIEILENINYRQFAYYIFDNSIQDKFFYH